jgi:ArsR family transcriptional regulator
MEERLRIFKALADPTRLKIVDFVLGGEKCVCEITKLIDRSQSTVSQQLSKLENLGIFESRRSGKSVYYTLVNEKVREIMKILEEE